MYISGKDKLGYINGDLPEPPQTDPAFKKQRTKNAVVKGWLINSMDLKLVSNFIRFPTAQVVWEAMLEKYNLQQNEWLRWIYREREKWAVVFGQNTFFVDIKGFHLGEILSKKFRNYLNPDLDVLQFFKQVCVCCCLS